jgi:hypothetical protein
MESGLFASHRVPEKRNFAISHLALNNPDVIIRFMRQVLSTSAHLPRRR